ncbi:hypothetical protein TNCV_4989951 [Trichonephila clavipes]|uniref:Uncharacterized protein n=1 Tax=Trichonephila clavipes TaxID=2585209 RepID=A0A8X6WC82_TRICX|nr:hypothetical protein TNCV_4989951 [Trichonephila clavipes]
MTPGMDPQRGLWNCAISPLVQRSSGDKLLGSDLYQEIRLKANNSFRSRCGPSRGMPVVENVDKITKIIEVDLHISSRSTAQKLKIEHETV